MEKVRLFQLLKECWRNDLVRIKTVHMRLYELYENKEFYRLRSKFTFKLFFRHQKSNGKSESN